MQHDLVVTGARLVTPTGVQAGWVAVDGGKIVRIVADDTPPDARVTYHAPASHYLLPGLVDSHVHFRTPGLTHKEDWQHASRAAAAGGVTTVIDMPNTRPPLVDPAAVRAKAELVDGSSLVDYRFHLGVDVAELSRLRTLQPRDAVSVKVFMAGHHTAPDVVRDPQVLDAIFGLAAECGLQLVLHAEDDATFALLDAARDQQLRYEDYEQARPRSGGIVAVARVIELVRKFGTHAHVLHVSSAEEVEQLVAARKAGLPVSFEVTSHHLSFTSSDTRRLGARIRVSPAIRTMSDQDHLWGALLRGDVDTLGSDHAPHTIEEKTQAADDAPPGIPGVQELAPAVFTGMRRRQPDVPPDRHASLLAQVFSTRPAQLFGIDHRKGSLEVGHDADFAVLDPDCVWMLASTAVESKAGWSAYEGWTMNGRIVSTFRRGELIFDGRESPVFGEPRGIWLDAKAPIQL